MQRLNKTKTGTLVLKSALLVLLASVNLYYGPSLLLYTPTITLEIYSNTEMPANTNLQLLRRELVEHFQKEFPNNVITTHPGVYYLTINGTKIMYSSIYVYRSYNITAVSVVVFWYLPLNIVIVSAIIAPLAFLNSKESPYYTKQRRKILFYGTGEMYFCESVIKHSGHSRD